MHLSVQKWLTIVKSSGFSSINQVQVQSS